MLALGGVDVKKSFKIICNLISAIVAISLLVTVIIYLIPEKICVSAKIIGENGTILYEDDNIELLTTKDTPLKLNEAFIQVLNKNNIEYVLNEDGEGISYMFGLKEYVNDEIYADSGAYWRMYVSSDPFVNIPSEIEIKNGDTIICEWCVYDRHQYCDHN